MIISSSESPEEATELLKEPMKKLRRVELATQYVELLKEVDELTVEARQHLPAEPKEALIPYTRLKELAITLHQLQEPAEGAAVHLVQYVEDTSTSLWLQMKKIMSDEFEAVLKKTNWPAETQDPTRQWIDCFDKLLDLQGPEIVAAREPLILLPFSVLAKPFVQEFKYHFFSDKATNAPQRVSLIISTERSILPCLGPVERDNKDMTSRYGMSTASWRVNVPPRLVFRPLAKLRLTIP